MTTPALYWGIDQTFSASVKPQVALAGASYRFDLGQDFRSNPILTLMDTSITRTLEADGSLSFSVPISGAALAAALEQEKTHTCIWQLRAVLPSGERVCQGSLQIRPSFGETVAAPTDPTPAPEAGFERTFTQSDLSISHILPVTHNLGTYPSGVSVWLETGEQISPDRITYLSTDAIAILLESFVPFPGTGRVSVIS